VTHVLTPGTPRSAAEEGRWGAARRTRRGTRGIRIGPTAPSPGIVVEGSGRGAPEGGRFWGGTAHPRSGTLWPTGTGPPGAGQSVCHGQRQHRGQGRGGSHRRTGARAPARPRPRRPPGRRGAAPGTPAGAAAPTAGAALRAGPGGCRSTTGAAVEMVGWTRRDQTERARDGEGGKSRGQGGCRSRG